MHKSTHTIVWGHLVLVAARFSDSLHCIAIKARESLGIGRPDPVVQWAKRKALPRRAVAVTDGVGAVSQKLEMS